MLTRGEEEGTKVGSFDSWIWILWVVLTHIGLIWLILSDTAISLFRLSGHYKTFRSTKKQKIMYELSAVGVDLVANNSLCCERNFDEEEGE